MQSCPWHMDKIQEIRRCGEEKTVLYKVMLAIVDVKEGWDHMQTPATQCFSEHKWLPHCLGY